MISVIIPSYRNPKYLDLCLQTCVENQVNEQEIIVILDGYAEESADVQEKYKDKVKFLALSQNHGMQYAINVGVMKSTNEWIFVINDDNVFPQEWDHRLLPTLEQNSVFTVNQIEPTGPGMFNFTVNDCGSRIENFDRRKFETVEREVAYPGTTDEGSIFPFVMHKRWFMAAGGFDTFYQSPNICDWDFFLKLQLNPVLEFHRLHHLSLYHFGSIVTRHGPEASKFREKQQFATKQYEYKWGVPPYNSPRTNSKVPPDGQFRGFNIN